MTEGVTAGTTMLLANCHYLTRRLVRIQTLSRRQPTQMTPRRPRPTRGSASASGARGATAVAVAQDVVVVGVPTRVVVGVGPVQLVGGGVPLMGVCEGGKLEAVAAEYEPTMDVA